MRAHYLRALVAGRGQIHKGIYIQALVSQATGPDPQDRSIPVLFEEDLIAMFYSSGAPSVPSQIRVLISDSTQMHCDLLRKRSHPCDIDSRSWLSHPPRPKFWRPSSNTGLRSRSSAATFKTGR